MSAVKKENLTMDSFSKSQYSCRRLGLVPILSAVIFATAGGGNANAQGPAAATPPYALFQYSNLTSSGNTMIATRVHVSRGDR